MCDIFKWVEFVLYYRPRENGSKSSTIPVQIIGNYNVFEVDSTCEAYKVGDNNILETKGKKLKLE